LIDIVTRQSTKPTLTVFFIHAIYQDKRDQMMFATDHGLFVLIEEKNRWEVYTNEDGAFAASDVAVNRRSSLDAVPRNNVTSMMEAADGRIWIGTGKGVVVLDP
jgi:ligand-binding sensor domain-containing protein